LIIVMAFGNRLHKKIDKLEEKIDKVATSL